MIGDVKHWLTDHRGNKDDQMLYIDDLLRNKTFAAYQANLAQKQTKWSQAFSKYYESKFGGGGTK